MQGEALQGLVGFLLGGPVVLVAVPIGRQQGHIRRLSLVMLGLAPAWQVCLLACWPVCPSSIHIEPCHAVLQVPGSTRANLLATTEHFVGILMSSVLLGIVVTKASLPSANLVFSSRVLFTTR